MIKIINLKIFKGNIEPQKDHSIEDQQVGRKLKLKHKNGM